MIWFSPLTGNGLSRPIDVDINNGGTFYTSSSNADDYIWVVNVDSKIKRFTTDGVLRGTYGEFGCDGTPGFFCKPTAIVSGRSDLLSAPFEPFAHTRYFYVADAGNNRIVWLLKDEFTETIFWLGEVGTTSTISDLEVDNFGQLWALDEANGVVTKYSYNLFPLCTFGSSGTGTNQLLEPTSIANTGGYLAGGNMTITESWGAESGLQYFSIGTDILDLTIFSQLNNSRHLIEYVLVDPSDVTVKITNSIGQEIKTLFDGGQFSGQASLVWDGTNNSGQKVGSGSYNMTIIDSCIYGDQTTQERTNVVVKNLTFTHNISCCIGIRGNVDNDSLESIDVGDLVYIMAFIFESGPEPRCLEEANVDGDLLDAIDLSDLIYLIDLIFSDPPGPLPPSCY